MTTQSTATKTNAKPSLGGQQIKARKRVQTAQAKFEPEIFRDQLFSLFNSVDSTDYDAVGQKLDQAGNTLDYRKYGETLFEVVIAGGLLAPGGSFVDDGASPSPFSVVSAPSADAKDVKPICDVINKLIRRYKFLQIILEESLKNAILPHVKGWSPDKLNKVATAIALWASSGLVGLTALNGLLKENLVKDGHALHFLTAVLKNYAQSHTAEQLASSFKKGGLSDLMEFFPLNQRTDAAFIEHFRKEGLPQVVQHRLKQQLNTLREQTRMHLTEMVQNNENQSAVVSYLREQLEIMQMDETEFVGLVWDGIMKSVDWSTRTDQLEAQALKTINQWAPVVAEFTSNSKSELALVQKVQVYAFEEAKLMKYFRQIVQVLYKHDVVSEGAIMYWYTKGAKPQGKNHFLNAIEPFIKVLREAESDDEEEEGEEGGD